MGATQHNESSARSPAQARMYPRAAKLHSGHKRQPEGRRGVGFTTSPLHGHKSARVGRGGRSRQYQSSESASAVTRTEGIRNSGVVVIESSKFLTSVPSTHVDVVTTR